MYVSSTPLRNASLVVQSLALVALLALLMHNVKVGIDSSVPYFTPSSQVNPAQIIPGPLPSPTNAATDITR